MADGQCTQGSEIVKPNVRKTRRIGDGVIGAFAGAPFTRATACGKLREAAQFLHSCKQPGRLHGAQHRHLQDIGCLRGREATLSSSARPARCPAGSTVDGFTLFERLEMKLDEHPSES